MTTCRHKRGQSFYSCPPMYMIHLFGAKPVWFYRCSKCGAVQIKGEKNWLTGEELDKFDAEHA